MKNIVLIGMPASGKSTVGVLLAKALGRGFLDTDLLIQQQENALLQDVIDQKGIDYFLDAECKAICALTAQDTVIATGGSAVLRDAAMQKLKENGVIVFLDVALLSVERRLHNIKTRGVAAKKGKTVREIFEERLPLYQKYADISVTSSEQAIEETVSSILNALKETDF